MYENEGTIDETSMLIDGRRTKKNQGLRGGTSGKRFLFLLDPTPHNFSRNKLRREKALDAEYFLLLLLFFI